jgi:heat shock protein HtpX
MSIMSSLRLVVLLGFLTAIFLAIGYYFAGTGGMLIGLLFAFVSNFLSYWYSDKFVLYLYRAKKISSRENPELHGILNRICKKADLPVPPLYMIDTDVPNAFATGRGPKNAAVAVTRGLMNKLDKKEVEAVLAHEIGHVKNRDTLVSTMAATLAGALTWFSYIFIFGDNRNRSIFSYLILFIVAPLAATMIKLAISRSREFGADTTGAKLSDPLDLASALEKISSDAKRTPLSGNESTAHLFIVNPFTTGNIIKLFSTHPPTEERTRRLRGMVHGKA